MDDDSKHVIAVRLFEELAGGRKVVSKQALGDYLKATHPEEFDDGDLDAIFEQLGFGQDGTEDELTFDVFYSAFASYLGGEDSSEEEDTDDDDGAEAPAAAATESSSTRAAAGTEEPSTDDDHALSDDSAPLFTQSNGGSRTLRIHVGGDDADASPPTKPSRSKMRRPRTGTSGNLASGRRARNGTAGRNRRPNSKGKKPNSRHGTMKKLKQQFLASTAATLTKRLSQSDIMFDEDETRRKPIGGAVEAGAASPPGGGKIRMRASAGRTHKRRPRFDTGITMTMDERVAALPVDPDLDTMSPAELIKQVKIMRIQAEDARDTIDAYMLEADRYRGAARAEFNVAADDVLQLEAEVAELSAHLQAVQQEFDVKDQQKFESDRERSKLKVRVHTLEKAASEREASLADLQGQLEAASANRDALRKEVQVLYDIMERVKEEDFDLWQRLQVAQDQFTQVGSARAQKLARLKAELLEEQELRKEAEDIAEELEVRLAESQRIREDLERQLVLWQRKYSALESDPERSLRKQMRDRSATDQPGKGSTGSMGSSLADQMKRKYRDRQGSERMLRALSPGRSSSPRRVRAGATASPKSMSGAVSPSAISGGGDRHGVALDSMDAMLVKRRATGISLVQLQDQIKELERANEQMKKATAQQSTMNGQLMNQLDKVVHKRTALEKLLAEQENELETLRFERDALKVTFGSPKARAVVASARKAAVAAGSGGPRSGQRASDAVKAAADRFTTGSGAVKMHVDSVIAVANSLALARRVRWKREMDALESRWRRDLETWAEEKTIHVEKIVIEVLEDGQDRDDLLSKWTPKRFLQHTAAEKRRAATAASLADAKVAPVPAVLEVDPGSTHEPSGRPRASAQTE